MEYVKYGHGKWIRKEYDASSVTITVNGQPLYGFGQDDLNQMRWAFKYAKAKCDYQREWKEYIDKNKNKKGLIQSLKKIQHASRK